MTKDIKEIFINDKRYPILLKSIYNPPKCLYCIGNVKLLKNISIAIVGCRDASQYGKKVAQYFAYNLAKNNFNIVSGLAKGIDSYSHIGALQANGNTIAVVGGGLDIIYPKENEQLAKKIIESGGLIISEYKIGTKPKKEFFPARNRIISGISNTILVVEAKERSGALITAEYGLEQGKDVFAVPGNINSINSIGTNKLIQEGAFPACNYKDILKSFTAWTY